VLPAATDTFQTILGESHAKELWNTPFANHTMGRRISYVSEDLCDQVTVQLKTPCFALQTDEANNVVKDTHLSAYV
jgi:hypothetical protein